VGPKKAIILSRNSPVAASRFRPLSAQGPDGPGVLLSALAVRYLPAPTHLIYLALVGVIVLQAAGVALMRETVTRKPGAIASLRPEIRLPRSLRRAVLTAVPVLFAVWSLAGLYGALGPALVHALTGSGDVVLGGLSLFLLTLTAVLAIIVLRGADARTALPSEPVSR
jgi:hypothetical protein